MPILFLGLNTKSELVRRLKDADMAFLQQAAQLDSANKSASRRTFRALTGL